MFVFDIHHLFLWYCTKNKIHHRNKYNKKKYVIKHKLPKKNNTKYKSFTFNLKIQFYLFIFFFLFAFLFEYLYRFFYFFFILQYDRKKKSRVLKFVWKCSCIFSTACLVSNKIWFHTSKIKNKYLQKKQIHIFLYHFLTVWETIAILRYCHGFNYTKAHGDHRNRKLRPRMHIATSFLLI